MLKEQGIRINHPAVLEASDGYVGFIKMDLAFVCTSRYLQFSSQLTASHEGRLLIPLKKLTED